MPKDDIKHEDLVIHQNNPSPEANIMVKEDVYIIVTQAFCPNGHNLVGIGKHTFDGYPGICLWIRDETREGMVELSPFHGDHTKYGPTFEEGKPSGENMGRWSNKLPTRAEMLKYLQTAQRYFYSQDWFGSEKRKNPA